MPTKKNKIYNNRTRKGAVLKKIMSFIDRNTPPELRKAAANVAKAQTNFNKLFTPAGRSPMPRQVDQNQLNKALKTLTDSKKQYNKVFNQQSEGFELKNMSVSKKGGKKNKKRKSHKKK